MGRAVYLVGRGRSVALLSVARTLAISGLVSTSVGRVVAICRVVDGTVIYSITSWVIWTRFLNEPWAIASGASLSSENINQTWFFRYKSTQMKRLTGALRTKCTCDIRNLLDSTLCLEGDRLQQAFYDLLRYSYCIELNRSLNSAWSRVYKNEKLPKLRDFGSVLKLDSKEYCLRLCPVSLWGGFEDNNNNIISSRKTSFYLYMLTNDRLTRGKLPSTYCTPSRHVSRVKIM